MADNAERHRAASHAMQTGVAMEMEHGLNKATEPKHLRVGVNVALCDHAALVRLLLAHGIISEGEYLGAIADEMEREAARYEDRLRAAGVLPQNARLG